MKILISALIVVFLILPSSLVLAQDYQLPFHGRWFVMAGGDTINVNHHMVEPSQWYGLDFMKTGGPQNRGVARGRAKSLEDYYSWGQPVLAPSDGIIRKSHDGDPDNQVGQRDEENAFGNHVVIEASASRFIYLAHFQKDSIQVKVDERVKMGQPLGKCGNSGNTSGPHVHMHVQDRLQPYTGRGQNVSFKGVTVLLSGKQFEGVDWPLIQGLYVWQGSDG